MFVSLWGWGARNYSSGKAAAARIYLRFRRHLGARRGRQGLVRGPRHNGFGKLLLISDLGANGCILDDLRGGARRAAATKV
mmetsp:Transcript_14616/g.43436  ORF Transcript_14616/g.43436 Transcript_14616/m.43436 type:complete len:81 (-) Transcript_14616:627-869(-)